MTTLYVAEDRQSLLTESPNERSNIVNYEFLLQCNWREMQNSSCKVVAHFVFNETEVTQFIREPIQILPFPAIFSHAYERVHHAVYGEGDRPRKWLRASIAHAAAFNRSMNSVNQWFSDCVTNMIDF